MASNSGWNKNVPSGSSSVALGDDDFRSFKSHMQAWWEDEHFATDGSANSAGEHKLGSARPHRASKSLLSQTADEARLFLEGGATSVNRLWSTGTGQVAPLGPRVSRIVENMASGSTNSVFAISAKTGGAGDTIAFGANYEVVPVVVASCETSAATSVRFSITSVTTANAVVDVWDASGNAILGDSVIVHLHAYGHRAVP